MSKDNNIFKNIDENTKVELRNLDNPESRVFSMNFADVPSPKYVETKSGEYVLNGKGHEYTRFLIDLQEKSTIHKSITNSTAQKITGEGVKIDFTTSVINEQQANGLTTWFNNVNKNGESINDVLKKCHKDHAILSYSTLNIIWSDDEKSIAEIYHLDASTVAFGKNNSVTNMPDYYYVSNDWSNLRKAENTPKAYSAFNPNKRNEQSQILVLKEYDTGSVYYSKPIYSAGINYILIDNLIGEFHKANLENGMTPSMWISFNNGEPSDAEKEKNYEDIKGAFGGAKKSGRIVVTHSNHKDNSPTFQTLSPNDSDKQFIMLNDTVTSQILRSHKANPVLFQASPGSLGQSTEIQNASELFYNDVIAPVQILFEQALQKLISYNGYEGVKLSIADSQPLSFTVNDLGNYLTKDEIRIKLGYPAIQQTDADKEPLLIEKIGIGGVQALTGLLTSPLQPEQITNALIYIFGLTDEQARKIVGNTPNQLPTNTPIQNDIK